MAHLRATRFLFSTPPISIKLKSPCKLSLLQRTSPSQAFSRRHHSQDATPVTTPTTPTTATSKSPDNPNNAFVSPSIAEGAGAAAMAGLIAAGMQGLSQDSSPPKQDTNSPKKRTRFDDIAAIELIDTMGDVPVAELIRLHGQGPVQAPFPLPDDPRDIPSVPWMDDSEDVVKGVEDSFVHEHVGAQATDVGNDDGFGFVEGATNLVGGAVEGATSLVGGAVEGAVEGAKNVVEGVTGWLGGMFGGGGD